MNKNHELIMPQNNTGLPQGWEVRHSNSKNLPYYFNEIQKQSRWDPPPGTDTARLKAFIAEHHNGPESRPAVSNSSTVDNQEKIRASHLLVKHKDSRRPSSWREENITRSKEEAFRSILTFEACIRSGTQTLGELAMRESDCSSAKKQGDLGVFTRGVMQKEFEDAAFRLMPGEISQIVETASGFHLIQRFESHTESIFEDLRLISIDWNKSDIYTIVQHHSMLDKRHFRA